MPCLVLPSVRTRKPVELQPGFQNALSDLQTIERDLQRIQGDLHGIRGDLPAIRAASNPGHAFQLEGRLCAPSRTHRVGGRRSPSLAIVRPEGTGGFSRRGIGTVNGGGSVVLSVPFRKVRVCRSAGSPHPGRGVFAGAARDVVPEIPVPDFRWAGCAPAERVAGADRRRACWQIVAKVVMPDHVHLFVRVGPTDAPAELVRGLRAAPHERCATSSRSYATTRSCCGHLRISPQPRSGMCRSRRFAVTSSISGTW